MTLADDPWAVFSDEHQDGDHLRIASQGKPGRRAGAVPGRAFAPRPRPGIVLAVVAYDAHAFLQRADGVGIRRLGARHVQRIGKAFDERGYRPRRRDAAHQVAVRQVHAGHLRLAPLHADAADFVEQRCRLLDAQNRLIRVRERGVVVGHALRQRLRAPARAALAHQPGHQDDDAEADHVGREVLVQVRPGAAPQIEQDPSRPHQRRERQQVVTHSRLAPRAGQAQQRQADVGPQQRQGGRQAAGRDAGEKRECEGDCRQDQHGDRQGASSSRKAEVAREPQCEEAADRVHGQ